MLADRRVAIAHKEPEDEMVCEFPPLCLVRIARLRQFRLVGRRPSHSVFPERKKPARRRGARPARQIMPYRSYHLYSTADEPRKKGFHRCIRGAPPGSATLEAAPAWGATWSELTTKGASTYGLQPADFWQVTRRKGMRQAAAPHPGTACTAVLSRLAGGSNRLTSLDKPCMAPISAPFASRT